MVTIKNTMEMNDRFTPNSKKNIKILEEFVNISNFANSAEIYIMTLTAIFNIQVVINQLKKYTLGLTPITCRPYLYRIVFSFIISVTIKMKMMKYGTRKNDDPNQLTTLKFLQTLGGLCGKSYVCTFSYGVFYPSFPNNINIC